MYKRLDDAISNNDVEGVQSLLAQKVDPNGDGEIITPLLRCAYSDWVSSEIMDVILKAGADPNKTNNVFGKYPIHFSAIYANVAKVKLLLKYNANPSVTTIDNWTPLMEASNCIDSPERLEVLTLLMSVD